MSASSGRRISTGGYAPRASTSSPRKTTRPRAPRHVPTSWRARDDAIGRLGLSLGAQPLQRRAQSRFRLLGLAAARALLLDHFFRRLGDESCVAEFGVDLGDLVGELLDLLLEPRARSEERRVGKECRSRGWPYH